MLTVLISSCTKEDSYACEKSQFIGNYSGTHNLNITTPVKLSIPISDNITISDISGSDSVIVTSSTLGVTLRAVVNDCKVIVNSASIDSFSYDLKGIIGVATVKNVSASLTVRKNTTKGQLESVISVNSGTVSSSTDLLKDLSIANTKLEGTFK